MTSTVTKIHFYVYPSRYMAHPWKVVQLYCYIYLDSMMRVLNQTFWYISSLHLHWLMRNLYVQCKIEVALKLCNDISKNIRLFTDALYLIVQNIILAHNTCFELVNVCVWTKMHVLYIEKDAYTLKEGNWYDPNTKKIITKRNRPPQKDCR